MNKNVEYIYEDIKNRIINLDFLPGTKIKEEDLAKEYNASRTPIREVIARLVKDTLLIVAPKRGTYVSKIDISNINYYIYIRKEDTRFSLFLPPPPEEWPCEDTVRGQLGCKQAERPHQKPPLP